MKKIITVLIVLAIVAMPASRARAVDPGTIINIIGIVVDIIGLLTTSQSGTVDTLTNTDGDLTGGPIAQVGDYGILTVVTDAVAGTVGYHWVKVTVYLADGSEMSEWSSEFLNWGKKTHHDFDYDIEGLYAGSDSVSAKVELYHTDGMGGRDKVATAWTSAQYFNNVLHAYGLRRVITTGSNRVRHHETFTMSLQAEVRTPKNGSAYGSNVRNSFSNFGLTGVGNGNAVSGWIEMNAYSSTHFDQPMGIVTSWDYNFQGGMMGDGPGIVGGIPVIMLLDHTPMHVLPKTFNLSPFRATFTIPKGNFFPGTSPKVDRPSDYQVTITKSTQVMTCSGSKIWDGESNTVGDPFDPDVHGPWAGWQATTTKVIEFHPPDTSTAAYDIKDFGMGGSIVETGVYTLGSPVLTTVSDSPTVDTHTYWVLSDSPDKLIMLDESGSIQNLTAGTTTPTGYIDGTISGLDPSLYDNTFVAAFSATTGYDTTPVALSKVNGGGIYTLSNLVPGPYYLAVYHIEPDPPSFPLPPDSSDTFIEHIYAIGGIDTPTLVSVPIGAPVPISIVPQDEVDTMGFVVSNLQGDLTIPKIELTAERKVKLHCEGPYGEIQMYTEATGWETAMGYYEGLPPEWSWTSYYSIDEKMAWFRCKY